MVSGIYVVFLAQPLGLYLERRGSATVKQRDTFPSDPYMDRQEMTLSACGLKGSTKWNLD